MGIKRRSQWKRQVNPAEPHCGFSAGGGRRALRGRHHRARLFFAASLGHAAARLHYPMAQASHICIHAADLARDMAVDSTAQPNTCCNVDTYTPHKIVFIKGMKRCQDDVSQSGFPWWSRDMVEVAPATEETAERGLSPESLLERLGFPRSQQHKQVLSVFVCHNEFEMMSSFHVLKHPAWHSLLASTSASVVVVLTTAEPSASASAAWHLVSLQLDLCPPIPCRSGCHPVGSKGGCNWRVCCAGAPTYCSSMRCGRRMHGRLHDCELVTGSSTSIQARYPPGLWACLLAPVGHEDSRAIPDVVGALLRLKFMMHSLAATTWT